MGLNKYAQERVEAILKHLPDDDESVLRAWVAQMAHDEKKAADRSGRQMDRVYGVALGAGVAFFLIFLVAWLSAPSGWPLRCPSVEDCPTATAPDEIRWTHEGGNTQRGYSDDWACIEWGGIFARVPKHRAPTTLQAP